MLLYKQNYNIFGFIYRKIKVFSKLQEGLNETTLAETHQIDRQRLRACMCAWVCNPNENITN